MEVVVMAAAVMEGAVSTVAGVKVAAEATVGAGMVVDADRIPRLMTLYNPYLRKVIAARILHTVHSSSVLLNLVKCVDLC